MALSKREKYILIFAITAIVILVSDKYIISPVVQQRKQTQADKQQLIAELESSKNLLKRKKMFHKKWKQMIEDGLCVDAAKAESSILRYLKNASQEYGLTLSSIQPDHKPGEKGLAYLEFVVAGFGDVASVYEFIYDVETSQLPLKFQGLQLGSKDSSGSEISIQMKLSSIYVSDQTTKKGS